jgi:hypothetical protein
MSWIDGSTSLIAAVRLVFLWTRSFAAFAVTLGDGRRPPGSGGGHRTLRANIDETVPPVLITEQGENRNQCEEQRDIFRFSHGFAGR